MTVTALCTTRNRREWLPQAIRCFQRQTYENRKMLILADGDAVDDLIPMDRRISLYKLADLPITLGEKKNSGCYLCDTDVIAMFDDDDWSAPERFADQMRRLEESAKSVTGYRSMLFTDGSEWWRYHGAQDFALGTSLCFRRDWWEEHQFNPVQIGSDNAFVGEANRFGQLASADAGELMIASNHRSTTNKRLDVSGRPDFENLSGFNGIDGYSFLGREAMACQ